ncbi:MAG: hypothetical protein QW117_02325 [Candidatus Pacearchaeota archaeon]
MVISKIRNNYVYLGKIEGKEIYYNKRDKIFLEETDYRYLIRIEKCMGLLNKIMENSI